MSITQLYRVHENGWDFDKGRDLGYFLNRFEAEEFKNKQPTIMASYRIDPIKAIELPNGDYYLLGDKVKVTT